MTTNTAMAVEPISTARVALGLAISIGSVAGCLFLEGGHLSSILGFTALVIVGGGIIGVSIAGFRPRLRTSLFRSLVTLGAGPADLSDAERLIVVKRLDTAAKAAISIGVIGQVLGMIHVMENLDKPDQIGPGIAVAFIACLYCLSFWTLFTSFRNNHLAILQSKTTDAVPHDEGSGVIAESFLSVVLLLFATFVVLYAIQIASPVAQ